MAGSPRPLTVLHEDEDTLFVAKPPRMLSVPAPVGSTDKGLSLLERLRREGRTVRAVHRIDYETSGVIVFAKSERAERLLIEAFRDRSADKVYLALVQGHPSPAKGRIDLPIRDLGATAAISASGAPAVTFYQVLRRLGPCSLLECRIPSGRHNQIRLHMAHVGHPLVGERKFARGAEAPIRHKRALLHAASLAFGPPIFPEHTRIEAPLPADFEEALLRAAELPADVASPKKGPVPHARRVTGNRNRRPVKTHRPKRRPPRR